MDERLPLPTSLSQTLVAFIIEFDNEFEHQVPHRTTNHGSTGSRSAPWLVSMVMWLMILRFVPDEGISVQVLQRQARLTTKEMRMWLARLAKWWGYLVVEPIATGAHSKPSASGLLVRPTPGGRLALDAWRPLAALIEKRWEQRFGRAAIDQLKESLRSIVAKLEADLPDYLPILGYELLNATPTGEKRAPAPSAEKNSTYSLPVLLSKILLAFAIEFESDSGLSLAISANVLRLVGPDGISVRDLPRLSGVSKEAIAASLGRLEERGLAIVQPPSRGAKLKLLALTSKGRDAQKKYRQLLWDIEARWQSRFGEESIRDLRQSLRLLAGAPNAQPSPLLRGLDRYPEGWRAAVPSREVLPHFPMILHRGGFPDGS